MQLCSNPTDDFDHSEMILIQGKWPQIAEKWGYKALKP